MTTKKFIFAFFLFYLSFFSVPISAQPLINKHVVMVEVYSEYSGIPPTILRLLIKPNSIERFLGDPTCQTIGKQISCDINSVKGEIVNYPEDLITQLPQAFLEKSNDLYSSLNDGGGWLIIITFDDGSSNTWGIFQSEENYSPEIQLFLKKISAILMQ